MSRTVMVIDDSGLEQFLAEIVIKNSQFADEVLCFSSPIHALVYLDSLENKFDKFPDVIFVDIQMPIMNGFDFLDKFLEFPVEIQHHCKIVMFSSSIAHEDHARMRGYPIIRRFLTKPLSEEQLINMVL